MSTSPKILVSSTVYDKKELLDQVYATLTGIGYEVWMSDKGTIPISSKGTAFSNCLEAVEQCDLFLGIISGYYGSGIDHPENSITHQEITKAISIEKTRWFLVHEDVIVIRNFVKAIKRFEKNTAIEVCSKLPLEKHDPISDIRVLAMYDEATRSNIELSKRTGNWVQHYRSSHEVLQFIKFQLGNPEKHLPVQ